MSTTNEPDKTDAPTSETEAAVRASTGGVAVITLAKLWFLVTGFAQPVALTYFLGREGYGVYGVVLNLVSILNNVVVAGSIQAMSRTVTHRGTASLRVGLRLHAVLGLALSGGLFASAGVIGAGVLHDAQLPSLLRIGAVIVADYCVYAALVGALNGQRRFRDQAILDITFATLRTVLVLGLAWRFGVPGAIAGFAFASFVILCVALVMQRGALRSDGRDEVRTMKFAREYARFFVPVLVYQLALNLVLQGDLLVLKGLLPRIRDLDDARINALAGVYKAAQNFAFLPYQLMLAVTFVVFPVVTLASQQGDRETTGRFVRGALRFSALALGAMLSVLTGLPYGVLRLAYSPEYAQGYRALRVLAVAQGAFTLSVIGTTLLLAIGRTRAAIGLLAAMLVATLAGDVAGITLSTTDLGAMEGTAVGTAAGCLLGLVLVAVMVRDALGAFVPAKTALRVIACTVVAALCAGRIPLHGKVGTLVASAITGAVYLALLALSGEVGRDELSMLRRSRRG